MKLIWFSSFRLVILILLCWVYICFYALCCLCIRSIIWWLLLPVYKNYVEQSAIFIGHAGFIRRSLSGKAESLITQYSILIRYFNRFQCVFSLSFFVWKTNAIGKPQLIITGTFMWFFSVFLFFLFSLIVVVAVLFYSCCCCLGFHIDCEF